MSDSLPLSIQNNRRMEQWLRFEPDRTVRLAVGKVELGQGNVTALAQIAADELDVAPERIAVLSGDTEEAPDEGQTTGSQSIEVSGRSVRLVSAELRARVLDRLAQRLNCSPTELTVENGVFRRGDAPTGHDYWNFATAEDFARDIEGNATPKPHTAYRYVGQPLPRRDLPAKLSGAGFIHDMTRPDMLHARILRQPCRGAHLAIAGRGRVCGGRNAASSASCGWATSSHSSATMRRWCSVPPRPRRCTRSGTMCRGSRPSSRRRRGWSGSHPMTACWAMRCRRPRPRMSRRQAIRVPMSRMPRWRPSCALAEYRNGQLSVWSHTQGVYPLRTALASVLGIAQDAITVRHAHGAGCYGHNGADDVAVDAAVIAMQIPDHCIRVQWRREEEFGFEPVGPAMHITLRAALDETGKPVDWTADIWSPTHVQRPSSGGNLLTHEALPTPPPEPRPTDPPEANGGGGTRNAFPLYDFAARRVVHHLVLRAPVRTSALRGLGALPNVFAIECFMDELAERAGVDPVEYRLSVLSDPRARRLVENIAQRCNWSSRGPAGSGRGLGLGWARYKNRAAYCAVAVELDVDQEVRLRHIWCAADAGLVINPDGARNQLEGGIVQAASMVLKEQVRMEGDGITSLDWAGYPILGFSEVPEIDTEIIHAPDLPTLGMGECSFGPTAAAIGNAVAHALGARIRDMPFTRERIEAALLR